MLILSEEPGAFQLQKSLCEAVLCSIDSKQYRRLWVKRDDTMVDVLEDGNLACAWYVSTILHTFGLAESPHTWVDHLVADLYRSDWSNVAMPDPGCILVWGPRRGPSGIHRHVGFYVGSGLAVSTSDVLRTPVQHVAWDNTREIELMLRHPALTRCNTC